MDQCTHEVRAEYWRKIIQALKCYTNVVTVVANKI